MISVIPYRPRITDKLPYSDSYTGFYNDVSYFIGNNAERLSGVLWILQNSLF